jgi:hypothetical protein
MIGILYICTGKYHIFWKDFYISAQSQLLPGTDKMYYVFTDADRIFAEDSLNVHKIYQKNLGWPYNTLMRFHIFLESKKIIVSCDYLFFANANTRIVNLIEGEILPTSSNDGLTATIHPLYWDLSNEHFPYDRNPNSTAYIPNGTGLKYFMGAFNGGQTEAFLQMATILKANTDKDLVRGIIARWHDESHLNHYMLDKRPLQLDPGYCYPEDVPVPFTKRVYILDKNNYGGHYYMRH